MKIGKRLKELRKEKKETQLQTAQAIGIAMRHYQRIEADDGLPGLEIFAALADHFGVSLDYLAGRSDRR
nr:helix-turn-helix transcriptional regulator [uncultured Dysosmobacter sp.]